MKKYIKGFTLIELLVVIAIIGILSSVVLVSLNTARNKGKDARVISDVQQIRTSLESGYTGASYGDLSNVTTANIPNSTCTATNYPGNGPGGATLNTLITDACSQGGGINFITSGTGATITNYAIYGRLVANTSQYFCIDSKGKTNAAATVSNTVDCP